MRFEEEMEVYMVKHPEYESQRNKKHLEKKRALGERNLRKSKRLRRDVKVVLTEDEASSEGSDDENVPEIEEAQTVCRPMFAQMRPEGPSEHPQPTVL